MMWFRMFAGSLTLLTSLYGMLINGYVFLAFRRNSHYRKGFYVLCTSRAVSNFLTCFIMLIWSSPCTLLGYLYLPHFYNVLFGQLAGWGAYIAGISIQLTMSLNRLIATLFPLRRASRSIEVYTSLGICWAIATAYTFIGMPDGCGYIFNVKDLTWSPMNEACALLLADFMFYSVLSLTVMSNSCNILILIRLISNIKSSSTFISSQQSSERQRKSRMMFAQSFTQDVLHIFDMISCRLFYKINSAVWFQFICLYYVWLLIHVFDGTIMLLFNKDIQPDFCNDRKKRKITITTIGTIDRSNVQKL